MSENEYVPQVGDVVSVRGEVSGVNSEDPEVENIITALTGDGERAVMNADLIAHAPTDLADLLAEVELWRDVASGCERAFTAAEARIDAALALHQSHHVYLNSFDPIGGYICGACGEPVESEPCATVRALRGDDA